MCAKSEVPPDTLPVRLAEEGVEVQYLDGRSVFYHGVPSRVEGSVETPPGKDVHVLITDEPGTEGVLVYVNERTTEDDILADTGVGRVLIEPGERTTVFPGVEVEGSRLRVEVTLDGAAVDGRVFVFAEDEFGEHSYELVCDSPE